MNVKEIRKSIKNKLSKSKIYEILNHYFYREEFLLWLENKEYKNTQPIDGNFVKRWAKILKFEEVERNAKS